MGAWAKFGGLVLVGIALSGCAGAPRVYELGAATTPAAFARHAGVRVRIPDPVATLDGDRILEREGDSRLALVPDVAWSDRLPEVVAASVTETLVKARIRASDERGTADVDYDLRLEIRDFAYDAPSQTVNVTIAARMVALASGRVISSRLFSATGAVAASDPEAIAAALDQAFRKVLIALPAFVAAAIF